MKYHTGAKWNVGKWSSAEYDKAVAVLFEECPSAFLTHVNEHKVMAKYVKGFQVVPADLVNLHGVWLDKA
jgi:peptide/nickel transport system substrate-binding protein